MMKCNQRKIINQKCRFTVDCHFSLWTLHYPFPTLSTVCPWTIPGAQVRERKNTPKKQIINKMKYQKI